MPKTISVLVKPASGRCNASCKYCFYKDEASLRAYATHPAHVAVADSKVRPFTKARVCMDFPV